ncbi:MAG: hypothetical protein ACI4E1_03535 [Lachnospira sp.]
MKRKILIVSLALVCFMMVGCGKKDELADYYENELGIDREDAEELADEFAEMNYDEEDYTYEEEASSPITLVSPSDEIVNSKITDMLVQVNNVVIPLDGTMTMQACFDALQADFGNTLSLDKNTLSIEKGKILEGLVDPKNLDYANVIDENENVICCLRYYNATNQTAKVSDCLVVDVNDPGRYEIYSLNFFYSGNICAGTSFNVYDDIRELEEYKQRLEEYPLLTYDTVPAYLETQDYPNVVFEKNSYYVGYKAYYYETNPICQVEGKDIYKKVEMLFAISEETSECTGYVRSIGFGEGDEIADYMFPPLEKCREIDISDIDELGKAALSENANLVAYYITYGDSGLIYQMDDGTYSGVEMDILRLYNGGLSINGEVETFGLHTESIEQLAEDNYITIDGITMLK